MFAIDHQSTFSVALPYGAMTLGTGAVGAILACSASSTVPAVIGIALTIFGAFGFYGVLTCGLLYSGNPKGFQENLYKHITVTVGAGFAEFLVKVAEIVIINLITNRK